MFEREVAVPDTFSHHSNRINYNKGVSSNHEEENQRGGIDDVKNFNYSFNPKVDIEITNAIVPYRHPINHKLAQLILHSPDSELSKELIEKSTFKIFQKILFEGEYDFENPRPIDFDRLKGVSGGWESVFIQDHNLNAMQTHTSLSTCIQGYGHNVETFLLLKQIKKKRGLRNNSSVKDSKFKNIWMQYK